MGCAFCIIVLAMALKSVIDNYSSFALIAAIVSGVTCMVLIIFWERAIKKNTPPPTPE
ncbi:hypothetical protein KKB18_09565 [bacterium]|nr:hypothetical protein [bacterium]